MSEKIYGYIASIDRLRGTYRLENPENGEWKDYDFRDESPQSYAEIDLKVGGNLQKYEGDLGDPQGVSLKCEMYELDGNYDCSNRATETIKYIPDYNQEIVSEVGNYEGYCKEIHICDTCRGNMDMLDRPVVYYKKEWEECDDPDTIYVVED